jgi:hypothetical protein
LPDRIISYGSLTRSLRHFNSSYIFQWYLTPRFTEEKNAGRGIVFETDTSNPLSISSRFYAESLKQPSLREQSNFSIHASATSHSPLLPIQMSAWASVGDRLIDTYIHSAGPVILLKHVDSSCISQVGYKKGATVCESVCVVLGEEPRSGLTARKDLSHRESAIGWDGKRVGGWDSAIVF